ncbi:hypothetical protein CC86DRAFT_373795 [Ophiobolus disseminans]|uniref:RING-type domain-containing protein n=1 Tax=Ophiobolus disseminans TaxID=1469910 RepID=A0A6A6ZKJ3_9PLEO|nr:hypothetical protein CC86DRAFT_373795 [Ophiobolus disseminans]
MSQLNSPASPTRDDYINQQLTPSSASDEKACPICYEGWNANKEPIIRTHCNHTFHRECFITWLGKEDVNSANSCPSCRAVCFPKVEHQKETGLTLDMSFLYQTMRSEYITRLPAPVNARSHRRVVSDEDMMRLAYGEDEDAD